MAQMRKTARSRNISHWLVYQELGEGNDANLRKKACHWLIHHQKRDTKHAKRRKDFVSHDYGSLQFRYSS